MILQLPNPAGHRHNHQYHERFDMHGMVLDRRADGDHHNIMICAMKKSAGKCLRVPELAYSHSIINKPRKGRIGADFRVVASVDTMNNTIIHNSCGNIALTDFAQRHYLGVGIQGMPRVPAPLPFEPEFRVGLERLSKRGRNRR